MEDKNDFPPKEIRFALGQGSNLGRAENLSEPLPKFAERFERPTTTQEKRHDYEVFNDRKQAYLKGSAGWFMRAHVEEGKRTRDSIKPGDIITFDVDYATPEWQRAFMAGEILPGYCLFGHTTRSHTPENPRFRIILPVSTPLPAEMFPAACRIIGQIIDPQMQYLDKVSARVAQMMYLPTVSRDMEEHYCIHKQNGQLADWQKAISVWELNNGPASDISGLPRFAGEGELREAAAKADDPLDKNGPVGTFCRAYSITELVQGKEGDPGDPILGEFYEITDYSNGVATRMTYSKGSTSNGAVVYEDKFVYSHHGSDPAGDRLVNGWDFVRIHLYGDDPDDQDKPMAQRDSWKKMVAFARDLKPYKDEQFVGRYSGFENLLSVDDLDEDDRSWVEQETAEDLLGFNAPDSDEYDLLGVKVETWDYDQPDRIETSLHDGYETAYKRLRAPKPPNEWQQSELMANQNGILLCNGYNMTKIVANDPRLHRKIAFNEFNQEECIIADIKYASPAVSNVICENRHAGTRMNVHVRNLIHTILQGPPNSDDRRPSGDIGYGMTRTADNLVERAIINAAQLNKFNPVLDQIQIWREMGPPEVDPIPDFFPRYFHTEKMAYTEQVARLMLIASIYRATTPGLKFDYMCVLRGEGGIGKSTIIRLLYGDEYFGELSAATHDRKTIEEETRGKWGIEMDEMDAFNKSDSASMKSFLTRQVDELRRVFRTDPEPFPRKFVVWGTLNNKVFLKDDTGNRRYWVIECGDKQADLTGFKEMRELLWRQAVYDHDQMRLETPRGNLPLYLTGEAAKAAAVAQEVHRVEQTWEKWRDAIVSYMETEDQVGTILLGAGLMDNLDPDEEDFQNLRGYPVAITMEVATNLLHTTTNIKLPGLQQNDQWARVVSELESDGWEVPRMQSGKQEGKKANSRVRGKAQKWIFFPGTTENERKRGFRLAGEGEAPGDSHTIEDDDLI